MTDEPADSDLRRRAAWLLAMLAVVAVLVVVLLSTLLRSSGGGGGGSDNGSGPDDTLGPTSGLTSAHRSSAPATPSTPSTPSSSTAEHATASCPSAAPCALDGDIGDAVGAINDYRKRNGQQVVPGTVSAQAKKCALGDGDGCSGGFAESQVAKPTGAAAVAKVSKLGKLLDRSMKSFEVGWAYDPHAKQYYFAVIRND